MLGHMNESDLLDDPVEQLQIWLREAEARPRSRTR